MILQIIIDSVRSRLLTLKVKESSAIQRVENVWEIQFQREKKSNNKSLLCGFCCVHKGVFGTKVEV